MSVHADRRGWVVRWRAGGSQRSRRFGSEGEAIAFDEGVSGAGKPRSSTPNVYSYKTANGTRWRYSYRDSRGRQSSKRGFASDRVQIVIYAYETGFNRPSAAADAAP